MDTGVKWCPRCRTFTGGFGGRSDDVFCHACGLDLRAKVYTEAEHEHLVRKAYADGYATGRKAEAQDAVKHMEVV